MLKIKDNKTKNNKKNFKHLAKYLYNTKINIDFSIKEINYVLCDNRWLNSEIEKLFQLNLSNFTINTKKEF